MAASIFRRSATQRSAIASVVRRLASSLGARARRLRSAVPRLVDAAIIRASGLFDAEHYLSRNADVRAAGVNPLWHYVSFGDREGRSPNPWFEPARYRETRLHPLWRRPTVLARYALSRRSDARRDGLAAASHDRAVPPSAEDARPDGLAWAATVLAGAWRDCGASKAPHPSAIARIWKALGSDAPFRDALWDYLRAKHASPGEADAADLPERLLLLETMLIGGDYEGALALGDALTQQHAIDDLRLQDIRGRARWLRKHAADRPRDAAEACQPYRGRFCPSPFESLAVFETRVYVCCSRYLPWSIGSIQAESIDAMWDSPLARDIRRSVLEGTFEYCNKMVCPRLRNDDLPLRTDPGLEPFYRQIIAHDAVSYPESFPRVVELAEDPTCNLTCPSCRAGPIRGNERFLRSFEENVLPGILRNPLRSLLVGGDGDSFASGHYRRILRGLDPARHRIDRLTVFTNGLRFDRKAWEELRHLERFDLEVRISVDAATEETYRVIRRGGRFGRLLENLELVSELRKSGKISRCMLLFVVQEANFLEMPELAALGRRLGADEVRFIPLDAAGEYREGGAVYASKSVHLRGHPRHEEYRAVLEDPRMRDPIVTTG